jgi:hypothetical protein
MTLSALNLNTSQFLCVDLIVAMLSFNALSSLAGQLMTEIARNVDDTEKSRNVEKD